MKTTKQESAKRAYNSPEIVYIELDNEISLALESTPPAGPDEGYSNTQECFNNDLFKTNIC